MANMSKVQDPVYSQVETTSDEDAVQNPDYVSSAIYTQDDAVFQCHVYAQIEPFLQEDASQNPAYGMIESSTQDGIVQLSSNPAYGQVETFIQDDDASLIYEVVD